MASESQVNILKQGVHAWNKWREDTDLNEPVFYYADLSGADFSGTFLQGVNLRETNLSRAGFSRANLREADLRATNLNGADLSGANLEGADLRGADFGATNLNGANCSWADLSLAKFIGANLNGADLEGADLSGSDLRGADLTNSKMSRTTLVAIDLSQVVGLGNVRHIGPSRIGIDTIYLSEGKVPEVFLRGAGVPDNFIAYMHSLVGTAFEYYSCFISYSSKDQEFAQRLYADLQANGVRCWYAPKDLKIGDKFRQRIDDAIRVHDKLLVVLSESSVASTWVESEVESAFERERAAENSTVLFPIRLDEAVMKTGKAWATDIRRTRHMGDFSRWQDDSSYEKAIHRLLRDLQGAKTEEGTPSRSAIE
jgi:hypothetical protein